MCSYLQQQHQLRVLDVNGDVERRLFKLAERVHVGAVFDERFCHAVMSVLCRPMKSRHLQHVFGVDVSATLKTQHTGDCCNSRSHKRYFLTLQVPAQARPRESTCNRRVREKYPNQQLHDDSVSLCSGHVQRRPVHFGASVPADPGSQQDVSGGVMTVLGREVEGRRAQLQTGEQTGDSSVSSVAGRQTTSPWKQGGLQVMSVTRAHPISGERRSIGH